MKKLALILSILLIGSSAYSETRIIRTYKPIPYSYSHPHCHRCNNVGYNNYYRPYYNNGYQYSPRYYNSRYNYSPQRNFFNRFNRSTDSMSQTERMLQRFRSDIESGIVPVANLKPLKSNDSRLLELEKATFGKDYSKNDLNLRLNRLEKSMFNKTFPDLNADERIENLLSNYNRQLKQVAPSVLSDMERCVWGRSYGAESTENRVSKLEEEVFGAMQQGDVQKRIKTLEHAILSSNNVTRPVQAPYGTCYGGYNPNQASYDPYMVDDFNGGNGIGNFFNNLGMIFGGGCPTGWSPQLTPYGQNYYGLQGDGDSEGYVGNTGYAYQNKRRGTGTGIQILD